MKIIFLNCWFDSDLFPEVSEFIANNSTSTDIFVLTELTESRLEKLKETLSSFNSFVAYDKKLFNSLCFQATFVKKSVEVKKYDHLLLFDSWDKKLEVPGFIQRLDIVLNDKELTVGGVQGLAHPGHKKDNEMRLKQSRDILSFIKSSNPTIFGGDFNLLPDTKSIEMLEKGGYRNLITEFDIKDTRGNLNHIKYSSDDIQYFADYCFVSNDVKVKSFKVLHVEISDHLPQILEFEI